MKTYNITQLVLTICVLSICNVAWSSENYETPAHLKSIVRTFIKNQHEINNKDDERVDIQINTLNSDVQLSRCQSKIQASFAQGNRIEDTSAIRLQCYTDSGWTIYVPVTVKLFSEVIATNRLIAPGEIISEHDIDYEAFDKNRLYDGFFKDKNDVLGLSPTKVLQPGTALTRKNIRKVALIKRNQTMTLLLKKGPIEIAMVGIAKSDGYLNDQIKVLNPSSKKVIDAVVMGPDLAQLVY